jgi:hypothetical protein
MAGRPLVVVAQDNGFAWPNRNAAERMACATFVPRMSLGPLYLTCEVLTIPPLCDTFSLGCHKRLRPSRAEVALNGRVVD